MCHSCSTNQQVKVINYKPQLPESGLFCSIEIQCLKYGNDLYSGNKIVQHFSVLFLVLAVFYSEFQFCQRDF